ncbi:reverse transcriptase domain-containing protein [Tanacetum coccineum]
MNTRSTSSNLFSPLRDPESLIRRRNLGEPSSNFRVKETMSIPHNNQGPPPAGPPPQNNNGPPPVVRPNGPALDLRSMEELCQPSINGRGRPIAPILIQATDFVLRHHMIQQVQNSCQFHELPGDDANRHIDKILEVTQHMKQNGVFDDALRLSLFPYSLTHHATAWYDLLPRNSIHSFDDMMRKFLSKYFPPSMVTKLRNEIMNFRQDPNKSLFEAWERYKLSIDRCPNHNMLLVTQIDMFYNGLTLRHRDTINAAAGGTFMQKTPEECYDLIENMTAHHNHWDTSATRDETSRTISSTTTTTTADSLEVVRQLEMMNKNFLDMMRQIQSVKSVSPKCETCGGPHSFTECPAVDGYTQEAAYATTVQPSNELSNYIKINGTITRAMQNQITTIKTEMKNDFETSMVKQSNELKNMMASFFQMQNPSGSKSLPSNTVANPRGDLKVVTTRSGVSFNGPTIPPTSSPLPKEVEREPEVTRDKVQTTSSESTTHVYPPVVRVPISEPDVAPKPNHKPLIHYPSRLNDQKLREKANNQILLSNKEKLFELANTPLNKNCSAVLLKKLPEKFGDPDKFLIPCDFPELDECLALADLGASINLMALFVWKKLSLPELTPTRMTLELTNRLVAYPVGVAEDVFIKVGKFYFPAEFVVVDYDVDLRVPLILGRPFLRTARALIDVHGEELTLRFNDEAITFKVGHTSRYSQVLGFSDSSTSGNPTPSDPIIASSSLSFTPFKGGDFILEEIETFLHTPDELSNLDDDYYDTEGDILYLEKLLNEDPSSNLPPMKNKDLNQVDVTMTKPLIKEPLELELKDLPSHLEYAFLKDTNKLPVIIAKDLEDDEKARLLKIPIDPQDQEKTTFTCPYGAFAYRRMPFNLCNAPVTFQRCMMAIFHDMIEETMEVFMDDFSIFEDSFSSCLSHLDKMLKRREDTNLVLNWEKCHFMVKKGIVLGHKISKSGIEVDKAKVDVIAKLPYPTSVKGVRRAENLAADHLSRLENPHQGDLEKKEINETFSLETLGMISFNGDSSIPWFTDIANYHAGNFLVKRLRIEQFFQVQDYALWDAIENGNSFKPVAQTTTNVDGTSTSLIPGPYKDAKTLFAAIQTRFGGNEATKKTQKTLLKQMYENFSAPSTESLDFIFNRLQKIVSQLAILGENISQEDLNLKFLRSLPSEWNTHVVVWRNKPDLDTMSFDDLYNNFKIVEQEVKGTASSSSSSSSQNMAFVSSPSSTNEVNTAYGTQVSHASTQVSTASTQVSTANLSDDTVYAFLASQPNGSQLVYKDLEQIHEDDIEEMDLKWQLALLSMRTIRGLRNQDSRNMNQDSSRRTVNMEETSSKAMVAIDGARLFLPPNLDLSYSGIEEFQQPKFEGYGPKPSKSVSEDISNKVRESLDAPLVEELVSDDKLEKKTDSSTVAKIEFVRPKQ